MKCQDCYRSGYYEVKVLKTGKSYILCHVHYLELCRNIVKNADSFFRDGIDKKADLASGDIEPDQSLRK